MNAHVIRNGDLLVLRVDGTVEPLPELPAGMRKRLQAIYALIGRGCHAIDVVRLRHLGEPPMLMFVDDNGAITEPPAPINQAATLLYHANCISGTIWPIRGDVIVGPESILDRP